jgi:hypothetical protein
LVINPEGIVGTQENKYLLFTVDVNASYQRCYSLFLCYFLDVSAQKVLLSLTFDIIMLSTCPPLWLFFPRRFFSVPTSDLDCMFTDPNAPSSTPPRSRPPPDRSSTTTKTCRLSRLCNSTLYLSGIFLSGILLSIFNVTPHPSSILVLI